MRVLLAFLLMLGVAQATPCDDARKNFKRAKEYGAHTFRCTDQYDGRATSSWIMDNDSYKRFQEAERKRRTRRGKS